MSLVAVPPLPESETVSLTGLAAGAGERGVRGGAGGIGGAVAIEVPRVRQRVAVGVVRVRRERDGERSEAGRTASRWRS